MIGKTTVTLIVNGNSEYFKYEVICLTPGLVRQSQCADTLGKAMEDLKYWENVANMMNEKLGYMP